jgi:hypothetical protein
MWWHTSVLVYAELQGRLRCGGLQFQSAWDKKFVRPPPQQGKNTELSSKCPLSQQWHETNIRGSWSRLSWAKITRAKRAGGMVQEEEGCQADNLFSNKVNYLHGFVKLFRGLFGVYYNTYYSLFSFRALPC